MKFQSNASFSKLAPTFITVVDNNGPYNSIGGTAANNTTTTLLGTAPAGSLWQIAHSEVWFQNATTTGSVTISMPGGDYISLPSAATAPGNTAALVSSSRFTTTGPITLHNTATGTTGAGVVVARQVPNNFGPT